MDSYKKNFIFLKKEGYVFQKIIQFTIIDSYAFTFLKILLMIMYMSVSNFKT